MTRSLSVALGALGFVAGEFAVTATTAPTLWYQPLERRFFFDRYAAAPAMDFYGRLAAASLAGLVFFGVGLVLFRHLSDGAARLWSRRLSVWLGSGLLATAALHAALLIHRVPVPLELTAP